MKFELEEFHRNTSEEEMLADVRRVAAELKKDSVTMDEYGEHGKYHPTTLTRKLGSWFNILEKAGLAINRSPMNIPDDELFRNLEEVWIKLGRQPRWEEFRKPLSRYAADTYAKRFGSWRKALEEFVSYINEDKVEESINDSATETTSTDEVSGRIFKHKTKREISDRLRFRILMRDGFTCKKCGRSPIKERDVELHVDHITPWSKGGETVPENLETKCSRCNLGKGNAFNE